jgi:hypothetical protein
MELKKISHGHFRIFFNFESGSLLLQNDLQHGTILQTPSIEENGKITLMKDKSQSLHSAEIIKIKIIDFKFLLYHPIFSEIQKFQHEANWRIFVQKCKDAVSRFKRLTILSSSANTRPPSHRIRLHSEYTILEKIGQGEFKII